MQEFALQGQFWNNRFTLKPTSYIVRGSFLTICRVPDLGMTELMWTSSMRQSCFSVLICNSNKCWKKEVVAQGGFTNSIFTWTHTRKLCRVNAYKSLPSACWENPHISCTKMKPTDRDELQRPLENLFSESTLTFNKMQPIQSMNVLSWDIALAWIWFNNFSHWFST